MIYAHLFRMCSKFHSTAAAQKSLSLSQTDPNSLSVSCDVFISSTIRFLVRQKISWMNGTPLFLLSNSFWFSFLVLLKWANDAFYQEIRKIRFNFPFNWVHFRLVKSQYFRTAITIYLIFIQFENRIVTNLYCVRSENLHQPNLFLASRESVRKFSFEQTREKKYRNKFAVISCEFPQWRWFSLYFFLLLVAHLIGELKAKNICNCRRNLIDVSDLVTKCHIFMQIFEAIPSSIRHQSDRFRV